MLQIIGWMGCVYLIVKGLELVSSNAHRGADDKLKGTAIAAALIAFVGAIIFFLLLNGQASSSLGGSTPTGLLSGSSASNNYLNTMNVDENLTTLDMNATDLNAADMAPTDMNAVR